MTLKKLIVLGVVVAAITAFFVFNGQQYLSLDQFREWVTEEPVLTAGLYFAIYVVVTGLSLPGAAIMTLIGGAIFGLWWGLLLVSFASSVGATLAFAVSRTLLGDWVQEKFSAQLQTINRGVEKDGAFYLFSLRLIPIIPFFVINLAFGLTPIRTWTFYWVSQLGMLAGTFVYVNAGAELGAVEELSASGILTPGIISAFLLLAAFPFLARALMGRLRNYQLYKPYPKPKSFDNNMVVIGAGSAGLVSALIAATVKAKVVLIERHRMGGDCLNTGCVPSKALIRSAKINHYIERATQFGLRAERGTVDFAGVMERVQKVIKKIEPHDSVERYTEMGVECVAGDAKVLSPYAVQVGNRVITTRNIVLASGARPFVPPIPGIEQTGYLTSDTLWELREQPERLLVMGAGPIGCELAQSFSRLGTGVTLVDMAPRIMPREDEDVSDYVAATFEREGIEVLVGHKAVGFRREGERQIARFDRDGVPVDVEFDQLLVAVGRKANVENMGLEDLGITTTPQGTLEVDEYLRTRYPNIYACGDLTGPYQFTHMAGHQAWYAAVNALFGRFKKFKVDYSVVPWATFTDPEVGRVGLNETDARQQGIDYEVTVYGIDDLDRAIADDEDRGFVKVLTRARSDKILGATIVGYHAAELIVEFITAMKHGIGLNKILATVHIYPTLSEANKYAAGVWKKARKPEGLLGWVEKYHAWQRRGGAGVNSTQSETVRS
ncbi:pyridine nucleotide-disulfide oxidoreductase [Exilibacterium tricleocarpae]|uniref:Pyridine nucleotide-disulfide oxidoreductase n=1 Tax=Exilibacterium tricleocarpae TaxID=2591008 RepID=A0A545SXD1_9GAMM|nr:FAD-dependent oxidoreductase [Exilibacterium tricleocarpae]TQV69616.1 pyridine nucleotide-disulfide oxidoreductase [Exilibacterium tricleocarpae]